MSNLYLKIALKINTIRLSRLKLNFNAEETFIISGDPRGGTTWIAEILTEIDNTLLVWEPLSPPMVKEIREIGFSFRQPIPESKSWPEAQMLFSKILKGNLISGYLVQNQRFSDVRSKDKALVKFCRANQLLPWLVKQFHFKYPPIYIVRHPCAVIASQLKQGGWDRIPASFEIPQCRYDDFYRKHETFLQTIDSKEKRLAAYWCLCNQVPLNHPNNNVSWITITYESLVMDGRKELARIEKRWGLKLPESSYKLLDKASKTTVAGSPVLEGKGSQLSYWQKQLSPKQIDDIFHVLDYFEINLYTRDVMPSIEFVD